MLSTAVLIALVSACSGSPTGLGSQQASQQEALNVAPGSVWLRIGESRQLTAWVSGSGVSVDSVAFSWTSSDPSVAFIDANGVVHAAGQGTARIGVRADVSGSATKNWERIDAALVTVTTEEQEHLISRVLGVPRLEPMWTNLPLTATYDSIFSVWGDKHWDRSDGKWEDTYYDRGLVWYAAWWRTGDARYLERGNADVLAYRDDYVIPNEGKVPPRWVFPEGLAVHYLLTGDLKSAEAVAKLAASQSEWLGTMLTTQYQDGRIQGRAVLAQLIAAEIGAPRLRDWDAETVRGVNAIYDWYTASGGSGAWQMASYCGGQAHFQVSHGLLEALIRYHDLVDPTDTRVPEVVGKSLDYMWEWWDGGAEAFGYNTVDCPNVGGTSPAPDLDLLIVWPYAWYFRLTGNETYRSRGDLIFQGGLRHTFWSGYKQFNQSFMRSYRYPFFAQ